MGNQKKRARSLKQALFFGLCVILVLAFIQYRQNAHLTPLVFQRQDGTETDRLLVEVVSTPAERARGLMYRKSLEPNHGMLFIFPEQAIQSFWMRNTYIALDMFFIDQNGVVVGVLENVPVLNDEKRTVGVPSLYVLELVAGSA